MKRLLFIISVIVTLSCNRIRVECDLDIKNPSTSNKIELRDALNNLNVFMAELSAADTKALYNKHININDCFAVSFNIQTKGASSNVSDTLLYVANFQDGNGYAVLAADRRLNNNVLCLTEKGSLDKGKFLKAKSILESKYYSEESDELYQDYVDSLFVPLLILSGAEGIMANGNNPGPEPPIGGGDGPTGIIGPYLLTKWTQEASPFNDLTPSNYPAGCVVLAVAQIMAYEEYPFSLTYNNVSCFWPQMKTVMSYPNAGSNGTTNGQIQVANLMVYLGNASNCAVTYGPSGSPTTTERAKQTLINNGYSNVSIISSYSSLSNSQRSAIFTQLFDGHPVYCSGHRSGGAGHAWVIDGYYPSYYHINWGWGGISDGYYAIGIFNTAQRSSISYIDSGVDRVDAKNYTYDFKIITYDLY